MIPGAASDPSLPGDAYRHLLAELAPRRVYLCPCPGNAGDELIVHGTRVLLESLGIEPTTDGGRADLLLYPGGNPTMWPRVLDTWCGIWRRFPRVPFLVGPSTFQTRDTRWVDALAAAAREIVALVARDPVSFDALGSVTPARGARVVLGHDAAFNLLGSARLRSWREGAREDHDLCSFRDDHEGLQSRAARALAALEGVVPFSGRLEHLARRRAVRARVRAISRGLRGDLPVWIGDAAGERFDVFLDLLLRSREVHTDRLHVAIGGALLGKAVTAYATDYSKIEAVHAHSMSGWSHLTFAGGTSR